ncbi:MAG: hypothetical protein KOO62_08640 [candidate division Zixibacteria bacterium]|nr:hypothetical protein [candidate division Zixibacteria bacterium]
MTETPTAEKTREELEIFRILKPYIAECLTLNHDLNNQLAGIIGYTEFLLQDPEGMSEEQCEYLNQIVNCTQRINQRVSALSTDKVALGEKVDLKRIIEDYKKEASSSN